jgi:hypothetical protein
MDICLSYCTTNCELILKIIRTKASTYVFTYGYPCRDFTEMAKLATVWLKEHVDQHFEVGRVDFMEI